MQVGFVSLSMKVDASGQNLEVGVGTPLYIIPFILCILFIVLLLGITQLHSTIKTNASATVGPMKNTHGGKGARTPEMVATHPEP